MEVSQWQSVRLGDLIKVEHGWPFKSECFNESLTGKPIIVSIGNFRYSGGFRFDSTTIKEYRGEYPKAYELKPGDILLVMTCQTPEGEILGIPGRIPDDGRQYLHNQRMGKVVIKTPELVDDAFLYYLFLWKDFNRELVASSTGTKIVHTAPTRIEAFHFQLPPKDIQKRIGAILSALDDKIELNRKMNRTLGELAQGLFRSWVVDFDPVVAKREGRRPVGVPDAVLPLFPEHFEDSELGPIPQGWSVEPLDAIAGFLNGLALQKFPPGSTATLPVIKIAELRAESTTGADRCGINLPKDYIIEDGDVLFSWSGTLHADLWCGGRGALNQHLFKVTSSRFPKWFYFHWVLEHLPEFQAIAADKATTMGHIRRHHLSDAKVVVPSEQVLGAMDSIQAPLLDQILVNRIESRNLAGLRDTLLDPLLSGELSLKEAERVAAAVL